MKRTSFFFGMLLAGTALLTSCTKDLKKDVKELEEQVNEMENIIGSNEPITATTTFKDNNDITRTVNGTYKFKTGGNQYHKLVKNLDGTYYVYILRLSSFGEATEGAWMEFTYNPTTKAITDKVAGHVWSDEDNYNDRAQYDEDEEFDGLTFNITLDKLDLNTGEISVKCTASGTSAYTLDAPEWFVPNRGKPVSTTFSFTGKLKKFEKEEE